MASCRSPHSRRRRADAPPYDRQHPSVRRANPRRPDPPGMADLPCLWRIRHVPLHADPALPGQRAGDQRDRPDEPHRRHPRDPSQQTEICAALVAVRGGPVAVLDGRPLHLQLPPLHPAPRSPVPLGRRRRLPVCLPGPDGRAAAARPATQPAAQPQQPDRRGDPDPRPLAPVVDPADHPLPARPDARPAAQARLRRIPARRHPPAGRLDPPAARQRSASALLLPAERERCRAAGDRLRLRDHDPGRILPPPVAARPRMDLIPVAVGRRRTAPLDGRAGAAGEGRRGQADPPATRPAHRSLADRTGVHPLEGDPPQRLRPARDRLCLDRPLLPRGHADGWTGAPTGALGRPRAPAQRVRQNARLLRHRRGDAERRAGRRHAPARRHRSGRSLHRRGRVDVGQGRPQRRGAGRSAPWHSPWEQRCWLSASPKPPSRSHSSPSSSAALDLPVAWSRGVVLPLSVGERVTHTLFSRDRSPCSASCVRRSGRSPPS